MRTLNRAGSQLGAASLKRHNSVKLTPKARLVRFLRRFDWKNRAQTNYSFGKKFLQRQPSFVITPDLSSFTYRFNNGDLVKRKPKARYNRSSQPVAAWKNSNPMQLLASGGSNPPAVPAPSFPLHGEPLSAFATRSGHQHSRSNDEDSDPRADTNPKDNQTSRREADKAARNWVRISLPLKPPRNQYSSHSREPSGNQDTLNIDQLGQQSQEDPNADVTGRDSHEFNQAKETRGTDQLALRTDEDPPSAESKKTKRSSWLNQIPQTPVQEFVHPEHDQSDKHEKSSSDKEHNKVTPESQKSIALAYAVTATPPESPTALPSSYRPESWRKSAILTRNSSYPDYIDEPSSLDGLAESWSAYLRHAVAQRAVNSKQRRSREMNDEIRWSQNLAWDSEGESARSFTSSSMRRAGSTSSGHSYSSGGETNEIYFERSREGYETDAKDYTHTKLDSSESITKTPHLSPQSPAIENSPISTAYAVTTHDSYVSPTLVRVNSPNRQSATKLAPLYSPRAMASASALAASSSNVALPLRTDNGDGKEDINDRDDNLPRPRVSSEGLAPSLWNRESGSSNSLVDDNASASSAASSSIFDEDEYIFPDHDRSFAVNQQAGEDESEEERAWSGSVHEQRTHAQRPSATSEEFDFSNRAGMKRPLPVSPLASPSQSTELLPAMQFDPINTSVHSTTDVSQIPDYKHRNAKSMDSLSSESSKEESAPAIIRSQSQWIQRSLSKQEGGYAARSRSASGQKRLKSSGSKEYLLHSRQKTLESQWGDEDEGEVEEEEEDGVDDLNSKL